MDCAKNPEPNTHLDQPTFEELDKTRVANNKKLIIQQLQKYIDRIDGYTNNGSDKTGYAHGFYFFAKSRALNREINYLQAKQLITLVERAEKLSDVHSFFAKNILAAARNGIVKHGEFDVNKDYKERGNNSSELNQVIKFACKLTS